MKRFWFQQLVLYLITIPIGELHTFWEHSTRVYNGVLFKTFNYPMEIQWYVKDNCEMINWVIVSVISYRFARKLGNKILSFVALIYVIWRTIDIPFYWYNYKTEGYGYIYMTLAAVGCVKVAIHFKHHK